MSSGRVSRWTLTILVVGSTLAMAIGGCATSPPPRTAGCQLEPPSTLDSMAETARAELATPACRGHFPAFFELALKRAESSPDAKNRARFADFIKASSDQGLVTQLQARELYNRYFHTTYVSLPGDYNICSTLRSKDQLFAALETELADKRRGMLTIAADRSGFQEAQRQYNDVQLVLEATALACTDQ
jgi:hypothetical protein